MGDIDRAVIRRAAELCDRLDELDVQIAELQSCSEISLSYCSGDARTQHFLAKRYVSEYPNAEWDHGAARPIIALLVKGLTEQRNQVQREIRKLRFRTSKEVAAQRVPPHKQSVRMLQQMVREESANIRLIKAS